MSKLILKTLLFAVIVLTFTDGANAQKSEPYVRVAKIVVDSAQLEAYKTELKTAIEAAVRIEPGVLTMYAVHDIKLPTHITILETYASPEAYQSHILTPHFKKYKTVTLAMVKSLELVDVTPIAYAVKKNH